MARLWSCGFELQSGILGDIQGTSGTYAITSVVKRSGTHSLVFDRAVAGVSYVYQNTGTTTNGQYIRSYIRIEQSVGNNACAFAIKVDDGLGDAILGATINTDDTVQFYYVDSGGAWTADGAKSLVLSKNTWYRVELYAKKRSNTRVDYILVLDGKNVSSGTVTIFDYSDPSLGATYFGFFLSTTGTVYYDDIAVNDDTGLYQNFFPGEGKIVHMHPNGPGDNNKSSGTWESVDEARPDDDTTYAVLDVDGDILDVSCESSSSAGIAASDKISLVQVGIRERAETAASASWAVRLKSVSGGTTLQGTTTSHDDTTYRTNGDAIPRIYTLTSYVDPSTFKPWTPTGANSLDEMQIGVIAIDATPDIRVTTLWALVEYVTTPAPVRPVVEKYYFYKIYTTGVYVTTWVDDVISEPSFRSTINGGSGELMVRLARSFDEFGEDVDVKLNNKVECYCVDRDEPNGVLIYSGYISGYRPIIREANQYVEVTCFNYVTELQRIILRDASGNTTLTYNSYDPANILKDVIDKLRSLGCSLNYSTTSIALTNTSVSYTFNTNTGKEALDKIIELCPVGWYWRVDATNTVYLQPKSLTAAHSFYLGKEIENLETYRRIEDLVNTVYFTGSGSPALFYKYENTGSQNTYGKYEKKLVDQRVTSSATASIMANRLIDQQKDPEIRSRFTIVDSNGPSSTLGYDIESIKVGQTLKIGNLRTGLETSTLWDVGLWDTDVWDQTISSQAADIVQILSLDYKPDSITVEASSRLPQIAKRIEDINRNLENTQTVNNPALAS